MIENSSPHSDKQQRYVWNQDWIRLNPYLYPVCDRCQKFSYIVPYPTKLCPSCLSVFDQNRSFACTLKQPKWLWRNISTIRQHLEIASLGSIIQDWNKLQPVIAMLNRPQLTTNRLTNFHEYQHDVEVTFEVFRLGHLISRILWSSFR